MLVVELDIAFDFSFPVVRENQLFFRIEFGVPEEDVEASVDTGEGLEANESSSAEGTSFCSGPLRGNFSCFFTDAEGRATCEWVLFMC